MTGILIIVAAAFVFVSEGSNPETLGQIPIGNKIAVSVFEGISGRTAGFSTFDYAYARPATDVFISLMMFIGGATASVAGGIKLTTFFVVVLSIYSIVKEKSHVTAFGREIDRPTITSARVQKNENAKHTISTA
jgi:trk system potassium uptake protein TrkH